MNKIVTFAAAKGGVFKTTSSIYLAAVRKDPDVQARAMLRIRRPAQPGGRWRPRNLAVPCPIWSRMQNYWI